MDPLSVTASIIALVGAAGDIGKGLKKVLRLRHAPDILLALNNEVVDLQCVIQDIDDVLRQHSEIINRPIYPSLYRGLTRAKETLLELDSLIAYQMTTVHGTDSHLRLDRSTWLRAEPHVQRLKDQIRSDRVDLSAALNLLAA